MLGTAIFYYILSSLVLVSRAQIQYFESCTVSPESYFYKNGSFTHDDNSSSSCESSTRQNETYLTCSQASIHDGYTGPQNFNDSSPSDYYNWTNDNLTQIEFRFSQNVSFRRFKVYFYVHQNPNISLPKLRFLLLKDDVYPECDGPIMPDVDIIIDAVSPDELVAGLHMREANLTGSASAVLLCILPSKLSTLALTEIQFCTTDPRAATTSPSQPSSTRIGQVSKNIGASTIETANSAAHKNLGTILSGSIVGCAIAILATIVVVITIAKKLHTKYKFRNIRSQNIRSESIKIQIRKKLRLQH